MRSTPSISHIIVRFNYVDLQSVWTSPGQVMGSGTLCRRNLFGYFDFRFGVHLLIISTFFFLVKKQGNYSDRNWFLNCNKHLKCYLLSQDAPSILEVQWWSLGAKGSFLTGGWMLRIPTKSGLGVKENIGSSLLGVRCSGHPPPLYEQLFPSTHISTMSSFQSRAPCP